MGPYLKNIFDPVTCLPAGRDDRAIFVIKKILLSIFISFFKKISKKEA
jgi:hypothetical protein